MKTLMKAGDLIMMWIDNLPREQVPFKTTGLIIDISYYGATILCDGVLESWDIYDLNLMATKARLYEEYIIDEAKVTRIQLRPKTHATKQ